ncbi:MAG: DUF1501 domain-containing protein [Opitutales bacterium]
MKNQNTPLPVTRRDFLRRSTFGGIGLLAFSGYAPLFLTRSAYAQVPRPEKDRSILVLIQLAGGNDGLNTVIPGSDDRYFNLRPQLAIREGTHAINDDLAFHPACAELAGLHHEGKLSIIQNVGYPNPNRSHFRSMEIWETATDSDVIGHYGWLGRFFDNACAGTPSTDPVGLHISGETPQAFLAEANHSLFGLANAGRARRGSRRGQDAADSDDENALLKQLASASGDDPNTSFLQHTLMDALVTEKRVQQILAGDQPEATYPGGRLSQSLQGVAALIAAGLETRVYFVTLGGFDTHANQAGSHQNLLTELSGAMQAFQQDLEARKLDGQVLTMTFSEFGRRPNENAGGGTDHGTAAPLFVMGSGLKAPLLGAAPDLNLRRGQDLQYTTDFRQVYATVLEKWLQAPSGEVLGQPFETLPFLV